MGKPRGATGTVAGIAATAVAHMFEKMLKDMPAIFQRTTAAEWLRGQYPGMDTATVEALLLALSRTPGVQQLPRAQYRQDKKKGAYYARNRNWSMSLGNVGIKDAHVLVGELSECCLTPTLARLRKRLREGLNALEEDYRDRK